jgi:hypothetical protein
MSHTHHHDRKRHRIHGRAWPYDYCATPGWWVRMMMTKPARRAAHLLEATLRNRVVPQSLDYYTDRVLWPHGRKPHVYYW